MGLLSLTLKTKWINFFPEMVKKPFLSSQHRSNPSFSFMNNFEGKKKQKREFFFKYFSTISVIFKQKPNLPKVFEKLIKS